MEQQSADLLGHRQRLIQRQKELAAMCERVSSYRGLEIPLDGLDQFSFLHFVTGSLPAQNLERLGKEVGDNVALLPLSPTKRAAVAFRNHHPSGLACPGKDIATGWFSA